METITLEVFGFSVTQIMNFLFTLFGGVLGGGITSTILAERWGDKRADRMLLMERAASLLKAYQHYARFIRRPPERRTEEEWDEIHAEFYAEARLIGFDPRFDVESKALIAIAAKLANLHKDKNLKDENRGKKEGQVGKDFREIVEKIATATHNR